MGGEFADIGFGVGNVAGLKGKELEGGFFAEFFFEDFDVAEQGDGGGAADVEDAIRSGAGGGVGSGAVPGGMGGGGAVEGPYDAFDDVVDVGEAAFMVSVVEDGDGFVFEDGFGEEEEGHIGAAPGAVNREKAKAGAGETVEVGVTVGHHFVGFFRGGVEGEGMLGALMFGEGHVGVGTIDGAGGGEDEVFDAVVTAAFEDVQEPDDVALHIDMGVLGGITHAGLGGEVDHAVGFVLLKEGLYCGAVGQIGVHVAVGGRVGKAGKPGLLEIHIIVVVEVVDADDPVAFGEEGVDKVGADKAGGTGDESGVGHEEG